MDLDMGVSLLGKFDQGLKKLTMKPSEYFQRQVRVAPLHTENTGWILKNVGKDILMFNTDYPTRKAERTRMVTLSVVLIPSRQTLMNWIDSIGGILRTILVSRADSQLGPDGSLAAMLRARL